MIYENDQILHVLLYDLWEKMLLHAAADDAKDNFCNNKKKKKKKYAKKMYSKNMLLYLRGENKMYHA